MQRTKAAGQKKGKKGGATERKRKKVKRDVWAMGNEKGEKEEENRILQNGQGTEKKTGARRACRQE